jgi:NADPH-dependent 2,4-dienoyl-CoA reductase/sulfur reductase-like enzyme
VKKYNYDIVVIGGGPAGLAAALEAKKNGVEKILICERSARLGGILEQCIHNGFGLTYFKEELTGPEYATRFIKAVEKTDIAIKRGTMVIDVTQDKVITAENGEDGLFEVQAKAIILAMGCRERTRESITIPGDRPAGVMTAGTAQRYVNINGYLPGKEIVILGSGDIGLIMARRMTLEGCNVKGVLELMPYSTGLMRNKVQCLDDFGIPLYLSHTITKIHGKERLSAVSIAEVDDHKQPVPGTEITVPCDTLLLSVGLIPENELSQKAGVAFDPVTKGPLADEKRCTSVPGIFACGNVLHVHDLVDNVSEEAQNAGRSAACYIKNQLTRRTQSIAVKAGNNIGYVVPQQIDFEPGKDKVVKLYMRVKHPAQKVAMTIANDQGNILASFKREVVAPGSMETLALPVKMIAGNPEFLKISVTN